MTMTQEDIERVAVDSCVFDYGMFNPELTPHYEQGFKDGANWRIKKLWHDASEEPAEREMLVVIDKDGDITQNDFMIDEFIGCDKWVDYVKDVGIIKWCYRKDLIPNRRAKL